uniref:Uncharacterized protein n=1 Tax=Klebsiella pneumoniae TaxID=573 RepID=L0AQU8_KLEPN|nr:hypothetical protein [Klebsiella pneumoniae]
MSLRTVRRDRVKHWRGALYLRVMRCVSSELRGVLLKPIDV